MGPPDRRNRVWQVDFYEIETLGGRIWLRCAVMDYAAKVCLACRVSTTMTHRDAVLAIDQVRQRAAKLLELGELAGDLLDVGTGELSRVTVVTNNGPAFKAARFTAYIAGVREMAQVRTRHKARWTNGVVELFFQTIEYEDLCRHELPDGPALYRRVAERRRRLQPHPPPQGSRPGAPLTIYLTDPNMREGQSVSESDTGKLDGPLGQAWSRGCVDPHWDRWKL